MCFTKLEMTLFEMRLFSPMKGMKPCLNCKVSQAKFNERKQLFSN